MADTDAEITALVREGLRHALSWEFTAALQVADELERRGVRLEAACLRWRALYATDPAGARTAMDEAADIDADALPVRLERIASTPRAQVTDELRDEARELLRDAEAEVSRSPLSPDAHVDLALARLVLDPESGPLALTAARQAVLLTDSAPWTLAVLRAVALTTKDHAVAVVATHRLRDAGASSLEQESMVAATLLNAGEPRLALDIVDLAPDPRAPETLQALSWPVSRSRYALALVTVLAALVGAALWWLSEPVARVVTGSLLALGLLYAVRPSVDLWRYARPPVRAALPAAALLGFPRWLPLVLLWPLAAIGLILGGVWLTTSIAVVVGAGVVLGVLVHLRSRTRRGGAR